MSFQLKRQDEEEHHRVTFTGASYCGRGTIDQLDFAEFVCVLTVGTNADGEKHMKRIGGTLPVKVVSVLVLIEGTLRTALRCLPNEYPNGIAVVKVRQGAVGALHLVDELMGSSNYVVFNLEHDSVGSAIDWFCEHGRSSIARLPQRKKND